MKVEQVRLGEALKLDRTPIVLDAEKQYRRIGIYSWGKGILHRPAVPGTEMGSMRYFEFPIPALVFSNIQAWEAAVAVAGDQERGMVASNRFLPYVEQAGIDVSLDYLKHYFLSDVGLKALRTASPGTQVRNRTLGKQLLEDLRIPLTSIHDQRRIAAHLDSVEQFRGDHATETNTVMALESAWLDRAFPIEEEMVPLITVANVYRGSTAVLAQDGEPFFGQASVRWGYLDASLAKRGASHWLDNVSPPRKTRAGDVLLNSTGDGTLGRAAVVTEEHAGHVTDSKILTIRTGESLMPGYLQLYLRSPAGRRQVLAAQGANTTKQTELGVRRAENLLVPVPPREKQAAVIAAWERMEVELRTMSALMERRDKALKSLLPAARNEVFNALQ